MHVGAIHHFGRLGHHIYLVIGMNYSVPPWIGQYIRVEPVQSQGKFISIREIVEERRIWLSLYMAFRGQETGGGEVYKEQRGK